MSALKIAAAYIRVSTEDQTEYSPSAQLSEIRKYASGHGFVIPEVYVFVDEGVSGKRTDGRDGFHAMIAKAKERPRPFEAILLWKFSRFARSREDSILYKSMLRKQLGIEVRSVSEPIGDDKLSILMEAMIEAMDEYYSINLAEEVKRGMTEKARRGGLQSPPPFGYCVKDNILTSIDSESQAVREIYARFAEGHSLLSIARWLNGQGLRTRRGNAFESRAVAYILCNPAYIGKLRWNPAGRTQRAFDCPELIFADGAHAGIIDPDLWRLVQLRMEWLKTNAGSAHYAGRRGDWLAGLVRCSACGGTLVFVKPNYWKCSRYIRGACSTSQHISDTKLRAMVLTCLEHDLGSPSMELTLLPRAPPDEKPEQRRLRAWQRELSNRLERLRLAYLAGTEELETYSREKEALERQEQAARRQLQDLTASPSSMDMELEAVRLGLAAFLASPQVNPERKQLAVRSIISQIFFDKNSGTLCVQYRLSPYPPPVEMRS